MGSSLLYVGRGRILMHCGSSLARSARYPIRPRSDTSYRTVITVPSVVIPTIIAMCRAGLTTRSCVQRVVGRACHTSLPSTNQDLIELFPAGATKPVSIPSESHSYALARLFGVVSVSQGGIFIFSERMQSAYECPAWKSSAGIVTWSELSTIN